MNEVEPAAGRREPRHLEGLGAAAPAGRARPGDLGGQDVRPCGRASRSRIKLDDLDVICAVLGCEIGELLIPEPDKVPAPGGAEPGRGRSRPPGPAVVPRRRDGRSLPPA